MRRQAVVEALGPDRCRVLAGSWSWDRLAAWVGMFDVDMEVVGPAELKDAARTADAAGKPRSRASNRARTPLPHATGPPHERQNDEGPAAVDACGAFVVCLNQSGRGGS